MSKIRVAICDDMPQILRHFKKIIQAAGDMEVVAEAETGKEMVALADKLQPDIILMDIQMESEDAGILATNKILSEHPDIKVIMLTVHKEDDLIFRAYGAGAIDYIIKTEESNEIVKSIRTVYNNDVFIRPVIAKKILNQFSVMHKRQESVMYTIAVIMSLTNSELEVLKLLLSGMSRKELADQRNVEYVTINTQIRNIMKKLGYSSTKEMIASMKAMKIFDIIKF